MTARTAVRVKHPFVERAFGAVAADPGDRDGP